MAKEFKYVRFLTATEHLTDANINLIYGEYRHYDRDGIVSARWRLKKEEGGYIFRDDRNHGTFGLWPDIYTCVAKGIDFGLRVYMADGIKFAEPEE